MRLTNKLNERFCKDMNLAIKLFQEPYFESRLKLYNKQFNTIKKYEMFKKLVNKFNNEQEYFEAYNKLKDAVIEHLKNSAGMARLNNEDMSKYSLTNTSFSSKDIYKETFDGKILLSIDMSKANFTALKHYSKDIVAGQNTYEDFIGLFTDEDYFKSSKYIRQVVFGNQNPKRQVTYEKYLMDRVLTDILPHLKDRSHVVSFSNDEIVMDLSSYEPDELNKTMDVVALVLKKFKEEGVELKQELFLLKKIPNTKGYIKKFINKPGHEFKSLDSIMMPFVLRAYNGEDVTEEDLVFEYEGRLAKLLSAPKIEVV
jgi:hypothetical protein